MVNVFPLNLAEWALHEPTPYRTAVRKATMALQHAAYDSAWQPKQTLSSAGREECLPFPCGMCDRRFATYQQFTAHRFAVHKEQCSARRFAKGTVCRVCLSQYWTESRLTNMTPCSVSPA